jgi:hypothetical protein
MLKRRRRFSAIADAFNRILFFYIILYFIILCCIILNILCYIRALDCCVHMDVRLLCVRVCVCVCVCARARACVRACVCVHTEERAVGDGGQHPAH